MPDPKLPPAPRVDAGIRNPDLLLAPAEDIACLGLADASCPREESLQLMSEHRLTGRVFHRQNELFALWIGICARVAQELLILGDVELAVRLEDLDAPDPRGRLTSIQKVDLLVGSRDPVLFDLLANDRLHEKPIPRLPYDPPQIGVWLPLLLFLLVGVAQDLVESLVG